MFDVIIIGKGPAGISAAIYTARAGLKTLVVSNGFGSLEKAEKIDNYFGFSETISGMELLSQGIKQAKKLKVVFAEDEIVSINGINEIQLKRYIQRAGINNRHRKDKKKSKNRQY